MTSIRILLTGHTGQLGWELARSLNVMGEVIFCNRAIADFTHPAALHAQVLGRRPEVIVNAAAYTAVDEAESESNEALATLINGEAVGALAHAAREVGALLIHYSTDYVFDGEQRKPYTEQAAVSPINAYGRSKRVGEQLIQQIEGDWLIFRTAWLYAARGRNFLRRILQLATEREGLGLEVVADQYGTPTSARRVAELTTHVLRQVINERRQRCFKSGLYHLTAAGQTSWYQFACEIVKQARRLSGTNAAMKAIKATQVRAVDSHAMATAARRPTYSVLCNDAFDQRFQLHRPDWKVGVAEVMEAYFLDKIIF